MTYQKSATKALLLHEAGIIDAALLPTIKGIVGFRSVLIHEYTKLELNTLIDIIENGLNTQLELVRLFIASISVQT